MKRMSYSLVLIAGTSLVLNAAPPRVAPLNHFLLRGIDGLPGFFDKTRVEETLWLMKEIKSIHNGVIKVAANGEPDPSRTSSSYQITFKERSGAARNQTLKTLIELENKASHFSPAEKAELDLIFKKVKSYFGKANKLMMAGAHGIQDPMIELIHEFCDKRNRKDSLLLNWKKGSSEEELYNNSIVSFKTLHLLSTDLMNFLSDLIMSCPKALRSYHDSLKK